MNKTLTSIVIGAVALVGACEKSKDKEAKAGVKCYGIAKAGQNGCGSLDGAHGCAGQAKVDNDPLEWILKDADECKKLGGMLPDEAKAAYEASKKKK